MSGADVNLGVHGGVHLSLGDSMFGFFSRQSDAAFFLHYRVWIMWQEGETGRVRYLSGMNTSFNGNAMLEVIVGMLLGWGCC